MMGQEISDIEKIEKSIDEICGLIFDHVEAINLLRKKRELLYKMIELKNSNYKKVETNGQ
jgi:hypothetical protein